MNARRIAATLTLAAALAAAATAAVASDDTPAAVEPAGNSVVVTSGSTGASDAVEDAVTYGQTLPANYRTLAPTPAFDVPSEKGNEAGELLGGVELESTGKTARADGTEWLEIKVPGRTTGWVKLSAVEEM